MKKIVLILWMLAAMCPLVYANDDPPVIKLEVNESKYLPPEMYGTWSIKATIVNSDAPPDMYSPSGTELWTLGEDHGSVFIKNIITNAQASITVDQVQGNTATFHHLAQIPDRQMKIMEIPTVTVEGDKLSGINRQRVVFFRGKKKIADYNLEIKVEGTRLAGGQVTFGAPQTTPDFEIAPIEEQK